MTEKDTKEETNEYENYDDYYNENDNYYIDKALGNIKDDPGSKRSRPRRIPVYKIQLTDEEKIPPMPEKLLKEPKDEEFKKKIDLIESTYNSSFIKNSDICVIFKNHRNHFIRKRVESKSIKKKLYSLSKMFVRNSNFI